MNLDTKLISQVCIVGIFAMMAYMTFTARNITVDMNSSVSERTISVDGNAETFVKPDTAKVSFGVTAKNMSTDIATKSVNDRMGTLVDELKKADVAEKDIKTINYDISPEYAYDNGTQRFEGYRVSQRVEVIIRDLKTVSQVLSIVNSADLDNVSQLTFFVDDEESVNKKLREQAIADAKVNAEKIAKDLGVDLDQVVSFYDYSDETYDPAPMYGAEKSMMNADLASSAPVVPEGENQFVSKVSVTYKIK